MNRYKHSVFIFSIILLGFSEIMVNDGMSHHINMNGESVSTRISQTETDIILSHNNQQKIDNSLDNIYKPELKEDVDFLLDYLKNHCDFDATDPSEINDVRNEIIRISKDLSPKQCLEFRDKIREIYFAKFGDTDAEK